MIMVLQTWVHWLGVRMPATPSVTGAVNGRLIVG